MSRPSATTPPPSAKDRWKRTIAARTRGNAATTGTDFVTSGPRIASLTSSPPRSTFGVPSSSRSAISAASASRATASSSAGSTPLRSASSVTVRYSAPVSRNL